MQNRKRDWKKYNKSLVNRGSINLWFDEKALAVTAKMERNQIKEVGQHKLEVRTYGFSDLFIAKL